MNEKELTQIIPKHTVRNHFYQKIFSLLIKFNSINNFLKSKKDILKLALNIERGVFNYTLSKYNFQDKSFYWNDIFKNIYILRAITIYVNLNPNSYLKNTNLINRLFDKEFNEFDLTMKFTAKELFPTKYYQLLEKYKEEDNLPNKITIEDGIFKCIKCAKQKLPAYKTTYYQLQTRSADESMTNYHSCLNCGAKWKS